MWRTAGEESEGRSRWILTVSLSLANDFLFRTALGVEKKRWSRARRELLRRAAMEEERVPREGGGGEERMEDVREEAMGRGRA